jgi:hypothetical protein
MGYMSPRALFVSAGRLIASATALAAIVTQFAAGNNAINCASFFTIESNLLAVGVLTYGALVRDGIIDGLRGASVTYLAITGLVYATMLSRGERVADSRIGWVDLVLHTLMPIAVLLDWLLVPPVRRIRFASALIWLAFPIAYGVYTMIRGERVHWFPYPMLDDRLAAGRIALNCAGLLAVAIAVIWVVVFLGNLMRPDRHVARAHA